MIIDALLLGVKDGQDILTLSLGGADGWTEGSATVVASRIAATGKIVTIAAGNDVGLESAHRVIVITTDVIHLQGSSGSWYTSGPGNGINVISVASSDKWVFPS